MHLNRVRLYKRLSVKSRDLLEVVSDVYPWRMTTLYSSCSGTQNVQCTWPLETGNRRWMTSQCPAFSLGAWGNVSLCRRSFNSPSPAISQIGLFNIFVRVSLWRDKRQQYNIKCYRKRYIMYIQGNLEKPDVFETSNIRQRILRRQIFVSFTFYI